MALFRRRSVWLPTLTGALLILVVLVSAVVLWGRWIGGHLAASDPARGQDGAGAQLLVVEGWLSESELAAAVAAFRGGRYQRVVASGGPFEDWPEGRAFSSYAERAADYLRRHGLAEVGVVAVPAPASAQDRSYLSAVVVRDWAAAAGLRVDAVDVFSSGAHARRTRMVYRMAFGPGIEVGIVATRPSWYDPEHWWTTSAGAKTVIGEALSVAWTHCCFWPAVRGSFSEHWAVPEPGR